MPTVEHEQIKANWGIVQERAISEGKQVGPTPFGYERQDGVLVPDDEERLLVQRAYDLAAGRGVAAATRYLQQNAAGARFWTTATVRRMLAKRTYLGEVRTGAIANTSAHEPLVDRATWRAAQRKPGAYTPPCEYPLSGVARCASCGQAMVAGPKSSNGRRMYRCVGAQTLAKARCLRPASIVADRLEQYVRQSVMSADEQLRQPHWNGNAERPTENRRPPLENWWSPLENGRQPLQNGRQPLENGRPPLGARRPQLEDWWSSRENRRSPLSSLVVEVAPGRGALDQRVRLLAEASREGLALESLR